MTRDKSKDMGMELARLALAGVLGGTLAFGAVGCSSGDSQESPSAVEPAGAQYSELHDCAGKNICKGLGGCKITSEKLQGLARERGIDPADAGDPHGCKGLNECKGLGGCSVDATKLKKLKAMQGG